LGLKGLVVVVVVVVVLLYWLRKSNRLVAAIQNDKASLFVTNGT
jgi:hypothetical protein